MIDDQVIRYDAGIVGRYLNVGNPIFYDDVYVTVTAVIRDDDRRRVIIQTRGDDDGRTRVSDIAYDALVDAGVVIQYGIRRPGDRYVRPVHLDHGARARRMARSSIAPWGGQLMIRDVIPDHTIIHGGRPVSDFQPVP